MVDHELNSGLIATNFTFIIYICCVYREKMVKTPFKQKTGTIFSLYTHQIEVKLLVIIPELNSGLSYTTFHFSRTLPFIVALSVNIYTKTKKLRI